MKKYASFRTGWNNVTSALAQYRLFLLILVALFAVAGSARFLRGDLLSGLGSTLGGGPESVAGSLRACSSEGTIFEGHENLGDVRGLYRQAMSGIVGEREKILATPSRWKCGAGPTGEPPMPILRAFAERMPGWHYRVTVPLLFGGLTVPVPRPVTFASFGAIVAELQREYECTLTELDDRTLPTVARNQDIEKPAQFCCLPDGCRESADASRCESPLTEDPLCGQMCSVALYTTDLSGRLPRLHDQLLEERTTSRVAVERTLHTLRSFEMNYATARQLWCYERATLDLKQEMSLLADTVSCMPKLWDAVTSIHDRKAP